MTYALAIARPGVYHFLLSVLLVQLLGLVVCKVAQQNLRDDLVAQPNAEVWSLSAEFAASAQRARARADAARLVERAAGGDRGR